MGEEVVENLQATLKYGIEAAKSSEQILLSKLAPLHSQFDELEKLLDQNNGIITPSQRKEKLYYLINVLNEWQMISKQSSSYSPQALRYAYNLSRNLKKVKKELRYEDASSSGAPVALPQITQFTGDAVSPSKSETYRESSRYVDPNKVYGVEDKALSMERLLLRQGTGDNTFRAIGIVGIAGIGKTALCQLIFSRAKVKENFLPRIWVCMSVEDKKVDSTKGIVKRMLTCLGVEDDFIDTVDERYGRRGLVFALRLQLTNKRYLIVLDDAWDNNQFYEELGFVSISDERRDYLSFGLPKGCGGTVIVTSRAEEVAKKMVSEENLQFHQLLSDHNSCWKIFKDAVEKDGKEFPSELENLRGEIVRKCDGLPLAARMMGQIAHEQLPPPLDAAATMTGQIAHEQLPPPDAAEIMIGQIVQEQNPPPEAVARMMGQIAQEQISPLDAAAAARMMGQIAHERLQPPGAAARMMGEIAHEQLPPPDAAARMIGQIAHEQIPPPDAAARMMGQIAHEQLPPLDAAARTMGQIEHEQLPPLEAVENQHESQ